ncbi:hypothetical protein ES288_A13G109900v1 [Gossypium darwinii]|uniref:Dof zinc finger protein n=1 Tax=Gossypium darwinii TaxID=34276 RepID=A0A5D2DYF3_GOSDA|nr:hypothetical protein ES288_A13G109900v1 [Gossypium darwinii]
MVFTSIPVYLDPPNWQQHSNHQAGPGNSVQHFPPPPLLAPHGAGSIRPGSMAGRARLANISVPEVALKCPRCESTNTKFCYLNNYSLTQPRHFCKTCKRYWTLGGALRNVPIGGGCRRNKRSKGSVPKSPVKGDRQTASGSSNTTISSNSFGRSDILGLGVGPQVPTLRFTAPLHLHNECGGGTDIGLNYGSVPASVGRTNDNLSYQKGSGLSGAGAAGTSLLSMTGLDQWRLQQPPQFAFLGASYQVESQGVEPSACGVRPKISSSMATLMASVKMEDNDQQEVRFSRPFLDVPGNDQYWGGTPWTDLSCFTSSSTKNPL